MVYLKDLPGFLDNIKKATVGAVRSLHLLVFDEEGDRGNRQRLRNFDGFQFVENSEDFNVKLEAIQANLTLVDLAAICFILNLSYDGTKQDLARRIMKTLMNLDQYTPDNEDEADEDKEDEERAYGEQREDVGELEDGVEKRSLVEEDCDEDFHPKMPSNKKQYRRNTKSNAEVPEKKTKFTMTFRDVQESIRNFTGEDNYTIEAWLADFEEIAEIMDWQPLEKLVCARRCVFGLARTFLQSERGLTTWTKFRTAMMEEFSRKITSAELHKNLASRIMGKNESCQQYYFAMREIASKGNIEEEAVVNYIVDGIQDSPTQKMSLYEATSLRELKVKLQVYEKLRRKLDIGKKFGSHFGSSGEAENVKSWTEKFQKKSTGTDEATGYGNPKGGAASDEGSKLKMRGDVKSSVRCYNCNGLGHISASCRKPKREPGSCYNCGDSSHQVSQCPSRKPKKFVSKVLPLDKTANVLAKEKDNDSKSSSPYLITVAINFEQVEGTNIPLNVVAMLDSGSPICLIKSSLLPNITFDNMSVSNNYDNYVGLNQSKVKILGVVKCNVVFDGIEIPVNLYVVPDTTMHFNVILGREFFNHDGLEITFVNNQTRIIKSTNNAEANEIMMIEPDVIESEIPLLINQNIDTSVHNSVKEIIHKFLNEKKPAYPETNFEAEIRLEANHKPFSFGCRRIPRPELIKLREIIDNLVNEGILRESNSTYASPIVLVKKKTGDLRLCIDFRYLNKHTIRDRYPLPLISEQLDKLRGKKYFTKLDLRNAFHHVKLSSSSTKYTSFVSPIGQFEYTRLPFGWCNSPAIFTRFINHILRKFIVNDKICLYLDDILIATETVEENLETLQHVLEVMNKNLLLLRLDKCVFLMTSINYLGYNIDELGISPCKEHIEAIRKYPVPKTVKDLQSFLGLLSYFRKFIKDFSLKAKPLTDLLRRGIEFNFGEKEIEIFNLLKEKLISAPVLAVYNPSAETQLHCDASSHGFGAVLMQRQNDNKFHPIAFFSKRTLQAEEKYHSFELECLCVIYSIKRFHTYLSGLQFTIFTDCNSLKLTLEKREINPRIARWQTNVSR